MKRSLLIILAAVALAAGCGQRSGRSGDAAATPADSLRAFPSVQVPGIYTSSMERQVYAAEHFWDRFFSGADGMKCDSVTVCGVPAAELETFFSTYVVLLQGIDIGEGRKDIRSLFGKIEARQLADTLSNVYNVFGRLMDRYLYDPNSPFRDEDLYQPYLEGLAASPVTDPDLAPSYAFAARMCSLNAIGTLAANFRFTDASGRSRSLYDVKAAYTLLLFSNPGCKSCEDIVKLIKDNAAISKSVSSGRVAVVTIYIDDDLKAWRSHLSSLPKEWYNGYDPGMVIRKTPLYNIRGIPSLYLLDKDKLVIMKDAPENRAISYLEGRLPK